MPGLTRYPGEGGPRIVQQPLSSGLRPMITMVIRPCVAVRLVSSHHVWLVYHVLDCSA